MIPRIALIGCGRWGRNILRDLIACGAEVVAVSPSSDDRSAATAAGAVRVHADLADLPTVDGYIVATPSNTHFDVVQRLLPFAKPIFVEKPMTVTAESAARLVGLGGDRLFVMQKWRYHPAIERIRQEIADGRFGEIRAIRIQRWGWGNSHADVNALWILMPHDLSIVMHWLGHLPPLHSVRRVVPGSIDAGLIVRLGSADPLVTIDMSTTAPLQRRDFILVGSAGSAELHSSDDATIYLRLGEPGSSEARAEEIRVSREMPLLLEIRAFLGYLAGGPPPMSSAQEGQAIVQRIAEIEAAASAAGAA